MRPVAEIADYGFLSDCRTAALVTRDGSIDWYCPPRFDAPSVFGRLLDEKAGHWSIRPRGEFRTERRYEGEGLVLRTEFQTETGRVELTDALALGARDRGHEIGSDVPHVLARRIRGLEGTAALEMELSPRFEYGLTIPRLVRTEGGLVARGGPVTLHLRTDLPLRIDGGSATASFDVGEGDAVGLALGYAPSYGTAPASLGADAAIDETMRAWASWTELHGTYAGRYPEQVRRSVLVLQGLTYQPSGAVAAAATTSLPEVPGGEWNWDYRFAWLRDLSFTLRAQWVAACPDEAGRFFTWIADALGRLEDQPVQIMYGLEGERDLHERTLTHLEGYAGSRPVRVGNEAWRHKQLDVMGEVLDAAHLFREQLGELDDRTRDLLVGFARRAAALWREPDAGMWEARDRERHYLSSKVLCWVALDRAVELAPMLGEDPGPWARTRDEIRETVLEEGWSERAGAYSGAFGSDELDASVLILPLVGFLPATDERMAATIERVERELGAGGLIRRWESDIGGFFLTTYWFIECLALAGEIERAERWFERVTGLGNDLGLLAEMVDPATEKLLGNFPQAFSHIGLVNAAWRLSEATMSEGGDRGSAGVP